jgi:formate dehydrogenase iron-sulfur subunit
MSAMVFEIDTPLDRYLAEQADLTAVERFAQLDHSLLQRSAVSRSESTTAPTENYYRSLIPLAKPKPGEQYAFAVDLDTCTGCKSCVTACHSLNGLDDDEAWRTVGLLHTAAEVGLAIGTTTTINLGTKQTTTITPKQQHVTTGCHHCVDPACLTGCPVNAYEKDPITGIVAHLDDQCIGCGYCTLTCPYEVPLYNEKRGIVRKCDMCAGRLAVGEAPACVQACPNEAIQITTVNKAEVRARSVVTTLMPGAPPSYITAPTTQFRSNNDAIASMRSADLFALRPATPHPPLAIMLVLTQLSVGAFVVDFILQHVVFPSRFSTLQPYNAGVALVMGLVALTASVFHLGRPKYAFRSILGFKHSWLSREAVAFGLFAASAVVYAAVSWLPRFDSLSAPIGVVVMSTGLAGLFCSIKIYQSTNRTWWAWRHAGTKFAMTAVVCGLAMIGATTAIVAPLVGSEGSNDLQANAQTVIIRPLAVLLIIGALMKLLHELWFFRHLRNDDPTDFKRTALLLVGPLRQTTQTRFLLGTVGGVLLPVMFLLFEQLHGRSLATIVVALGAIVTLVCVTCGELLERYQFFRAVSVPRMPGALT